MELPQDFVADTLGSDYPKPPHKWDPRDTKYNHPDPILVFDIMVLVERVRVQHVLLKCICNVFTVILLMRCTTCNSVPTVDSRTEHVL